MSNQNFIKREAHEAEHIAEAEKVHDHHEKDAERIGDGTVNKQKGGPKKVRGNGKKKGS